MNPKVSAAFRKTDASLFAKTHLDVGILSAHLQRQGRQFQAYGYDPSLYNLKERYPINIGVTHRRRLS